MEDETHLVGNRALAGGAVGGELHFVHLDQVLGLAADAIDVLVEVASLGYGLNSVPSMMVRRYNLRQPWG